MEEGQGREEALEQLVKEYQWNRIEPELPFKIAVLYRELGDIEQALSFFRIVRRDYRPFAPHSVPHAETLHQAGRTPEALELIGEGLVLAEGIANEDLRLRLTALKGRIKLQTE